MKSGIKLLHDVLGEGELVQRQRHYSVRLRMWRNGEPVRWSTASGPVGRSSLEDDGATMLTEILINRGRLINGIFYGVEGMRVGGTRRIEISPHLAYGDRGVPGIIPPNAVITAEITVLSAVSPMAGYTSPQSK